jgi:DNA-binding response OmpR family regulator
MARIYIADDDADIRNLLTFTLIEEGHEVLAAKDGEMAIEAITKEPPDVLVLDMMMPKLDGLGVLKRLEESGALGRTRVLILTAKSAERDRVVGLEQGADQYLTKPFDPDELIGAVDALLGSTIEELAIRREAERDKASLLAQLDAVFQDPKVN